MVPRSYAYGPFARLRRGEETLLSVVASGYSRPREFVMNLGIPKSTVANAAKRFKRVVRGALSS